ncbi:MAG: Lrp/AsnC family transcriptional regulator [Tissierellia bacterium]|nr:Lrp/AsnC family transcriptional regulator [Tissierellia bacterium]
MDSIDQKILTILQNNGRATVKSIGDKVGLSSPATAERIHKLEDAGIILGYRTIIDPRCVGKSLEAFIGVNILHNREKPFYEFCASSPLIYSHYRVIGQFNAILHVYVHDTAELEELIDDIKLNGSTNTSIVLSVLFDNKVF